MNAETFVAADRFVLSRKPGRYGIAAIVLLSVGGFEAAFAFSGKQTSTTKDESVAALESVPSAATLFPFPPSQFDQAQAAVERGDHELALHAYKKSFAEDPEYHEATIPAVVKIYLNRAVDHHSRGQYLEELNQLHFCHKQLEDWKASDSSGKSLAEPARQQLFAAIARVQQVGSQTIDDHLGECQRLAHEAKGPHWWNDDDEVKQKEALGRLYLAWGYHPQFTSNNDVERLYNLWADLKGELSERDYQAVTELYRLKLGKDGPIR